MEQEVLEMHDRISRELFKQNGGIESLGASLSGGWMPEVCVYRDYPNRKELVRRIMEIAPLATIEYVDGMGRDCDGGSVRACGCAK
jgi:hypothetical protein